LVNGQVWITGAGVMKYRSNSTTYTVTATS
jgi:hypothetical protein